MSKIVLGQAHGKNVSLDVETVLRTRLLIQGGSGSGKSWLIRRIGEQLFGKLPVIIIDPEGEFASLREKYGYVLVGQGGETPADVRSAGLVAHKLLELHASAVCDIYEMKPHERHRWVKLFLEALIDAPKTLWQPAVIVVDEAHLFAPEKGAGESEATDAMTALTTRGRKRGYSPVFATQRLGKLRKDAAAELQNVILGRTFIDIDRKRALETLGVAKDDAKAFSHELKTLPEGQFWAFGPAITLERTLVTIGPVETTHPKLGTARKSEPPPAPEKVRALLPKLADLPQQAEQKALTEADLRKQIAELKAQKAKLEQDVAKAAGTPAPAGKTKDVPVLTDADRTLIDKLFARLDDRDARALTLIAAAESDLNRIVQSATAEYLNTTRNVALDVAKEVAALVERAGLKTIREKLDRVIPQNAPVSARSEKNIGVLPRSRPIPNPSAIRPVRTAPSPSTNGHLPGPEQKILNGLAELEVLGLTPVDRQQLALMAGYTNFRSGGFSEPLGRLIAGGYAVSPLAGVIDLTEDGRTHANVAATPTDSDALQARIMGVLPSPEQRILAKLIELYPNPITREELAGALGYTNFRSGGFSEPLGHLATLKLIDTPRGAAVASSKLFLT